MKKFVMFLTLALFAVAVTFAQRVAISNYVQITGTAADTVISGTYCSVPVAVTLRGPYYMHVETDLDELSGSATASVVLQGSPDGSHWTALDTLTATADATVKFTIGNPWNSGKSQIWKQLRTYTTLSTTGKWKVLYNRFVVAAL